MNKDVKVLPKWLIIGNDLGKHFDNWIFKDIKIMSSKNFNDIRKHV